MAKKLNKKELYKNITLIFLIALAGILFFRLWFGNWIWSYDTDNSGKTFFGLFDTSSKSEPVNAEDIIMPKRLVLTGGGKRIILKKGTDEFSKCYNSLIDLSGQIETGAAKPSAATEEEFAAALKSFSVFLDFGSAYGREFLSLVGEDLPVSATQYILLTPGDAVIQKVNVYIKDYASGAVSKFVSEIPSSSLTGLIDSHISAGSAGNIPFAFELGFDKAKQQETTEISHTILLDSYITMSLTDEAVDNISVSVPRLFAEITDNPSASDKIVSLFGFSPTSTRRYIEKDDVTTFVNKNGTIKFSRSGVLEYTAENDGISVTNGTDSADDTALGNIYSLIQNILIDSGIGETQLHIASDLYGIANKNGSAVINIDYIINGRPVTIVDGGSAVHPITITLENGKIVSYKHYVYSFRTGDGQTLTSSMIKAVDLLYSQFENASDSVTVLDLYKSYVHTVGGDTQPLWCAKLKDHSDTAIIWE